MFSWEREGRYCCTTSMAIENKFILVHTCSFLNFTTYSSKTQTMWTWENVRHFWNQHHKESDQICTPYEITMQEWKPKIPHISSCSFHSRFKRGHLWGHQPTCNYSFQVLTDQGTYGTSVSVRDLFLSQWMCWTLQSNVYFKFSSVWKI